MTRRGRVREEELAETLRALYVRTDDELRERFARSLPFQDGLFDRWERARRLGFGAGTSIYNSALVFGEVLVGRQTWIGPHALLDGSGGKLSIGDYCSISAGVHLYTHDTVHHALSGGALPKRSGAVRIGDCVYVGAQSVIALGVVIGSRSVVAANSFVNEAVPSRTVVGGSPARPIGRVIGDGEKVRIEFDTLVAGRRSKRSVRRAGARA
jgi:carbonic anhydrase/acetyltransferase-like protein (isoleucine patch superfamily)